MGFRVEFISVWSHFFSLKKALMLNSNFKLISCNSFQLLTDFEDFFSYGNK